MNFEDFENKFRESDPARSLTPAEAHHHDHMIERALSADTTHLPPVSRWTTRRKVTSSAAAALLLGGLMAPTLTGSMVAGGPERLVFTTASGNQMGAPEADGNRLAGDAKMGSSALAPMWMWGNTTYVVDGSFSDEAGTGAGYEVVAPNNAVGLLKEIAATLGVGSLTFDDQGKSWSSGSSDYTKPQFWGSDGSYGDGGNFSFYNPQLDPWSRCYGSKESDATDPSIAPDQTCNPAPATNLPSQAEAKALAKQWIAKLGLDTSNIRFETYGEAGADQYSVSVSAIRTQDGFDTPFSWWFNFVDNGKLQSVSGSLGELKSIGVYDLIAPSAVIARIEAMNAAQKAAWEAQNENMGTATSGAAEVTDAPAPVATASSEPGASGSGSSGSSTGTASDMPIEPMPGPISNDVVVHVTRIERTMVTAYLADNRMVWLPGYSIWGWTEGDDTKTVYQMNSVVGIVESQIDVNSLFSWGPVMAMDGVRAVR